MPLADQVLVLEQLIYNRKRLVAAMVNADEYHAFKVWSERKSKRSLADEFTELRRIITEEDYELRIPLRSTRDFEDCGIGLLNPFSNNAR